MKITSQQALFLMVVCTLFLAAGQFFMKSAATTFSLTIQGLVLNWFLWAGLICAGLGSVIMTLALRSGELSKVFPLVSLTFVWTALIAIFIFHEVLALPIIIGIAFVIAGVIILGQSEVAL